MRFEGIKIKNYRSYDAQGITIDNLGKVNIFIGKNNSGKSNLLMFIDKIALTLHNSSNVPAFVKKDYYDYDDKKAISFSIKYNKTLVHSLIDSSDQISMSIKSTWKKNIQSDIWQGPDIAKIIDLIFEKIKPVFIIPRDSIFHIGVFRKIITTGNSFDKNQHEYWRQVFNGENLIRELDSLKNPKAENSKIQRQKFNKIEKFIQSILNNPNITITVSEGNDELQIEDRTTGTLTALENLGTGIHQLVLLAISVTQNENKIICIEEPEIYLNPDLQKKLVRFLLKETNNQYFITTHSNSFINIDGIDIYHVTHDDLKSKIEKVISSANKSIILDDLGYHASDILQTNFLIWVEGPSDRIYLNHWIKGKASDLIEGIHYTIMFYGGRLLSHLTAQSEEIEDFICLNKINRNIAIIIDSDKNRETDTLNSTKERVVKEFNQQGYLYWVTQGREIENYIDKNTLLPLTSEFNGLNIEEKNDPFHKRTKRNETNVDKISLAKKIISLPANYSILDLDEKIDLLVYRIKKANNL